MSTLTNNYGLTLPEQEDYYNVDIFNDNNVVIDTELKRLSDLTGGLGAVAFTGKYKDLEGLPALHSKTDSIIVATSDSSDGLEDIVYDGSAESLSKLNSAIAGLENGGSVYFKAGDYVFNGKLFTDKENVHLRGCGNASRLIFTGGSLSFANEGITVSDLCISSSIEQGGEDTGMILLDASTGFSRANRLCFYNVSFEYTADQTYGRLIFEAPLGGVTGLRLVNCSFVNTGSRFNNTRLIKSTADDATFTGCVCACVVTGDSITADSGLTLSGNCGIEAGA
jgi:hypothetical protein